MVGDLRPTVDMTNLRFRQNMPRSIFTACPDGIVQWPRSTIGPVEKQPTRVYSHIG